MCLKQKSITLSGEISNICRYNSYDNYNIRNSGRELKGCIWLQIFCILECGSTIEWERLSMYTLIPRQSLTKEI